MILRLVFICRFYMSFLYNGKLMKSKQANANNLTKKSLELLQQQNDIILTSLSSVTLSQH